MSGGEREAKKRRTEGGAPAPLLLGGRELPTAVLIHALSYLSAWRLYALLGVNKEMQRVATITPRNAYTAWRVDTRIPSEDGLAHRLVEMQREGKTLSLRAIPGPYRRLEIHGAADAAPVDQMVNHVMYTSHDILRVLRTPETVFERLGSPRGLLALQTRRRVHERASISRVIKNVSGTATKLRELALDVLPFTMPSLFPLSTLPLRSLLFRPFGYSEFPDVSHSADRIVVSEVDKRSAELPELRILMLPPEWLALVNAPKVTHLKMSSYLYYGVDHDHAEEIEIETIELTKEQIAKIHKKFPLLQVLEMYDPRENEDLPWETDLEGPEYLPEGKDIQMKHLRVVHITCDVIPGFLATASLPALEHLEVYLMNASGYVSGTRLFRTLRNTAHVKTARLTMEPDNYRHDDAEDAKDDRESLDLLVAEDEARGGRIDVAWERVCLPGCAMLAAAVLRRVRFTKKNPRITVYSQTCCWHKDDLPTSKFLETFSALIQREFQSIHRDEKAPVGSLGDLKKDTPPEAAAFYKAKMASEEEVAILAQTNA